MKRSPSVVVFGDLLVDVVMPIESYPPPGGDGMANETIIRAGGSAVNTACALAKLGVKTRLLGRTGKDPWGEFELSQLRSVGVDVSGVIQDPLLGTGLTFAPVLPDGERTLFSYRGANNATTPEEIRPAWFEGVDLLHVSGYAFVNSPQREAAWRTIELAKAAGGLISLDTALAPALEHRDEIEQVLKQADIGILGMEEAQALTGQSDLAQAADGLLALGLRLAAIKLGARGCYLATPAQRVMVPGIRVDVVDTTGAGDAFGAGLIYGYLGGLDVSAAGFLAVVMGGLAATVWGAGAGLPGREEVKAWLEKESSAQQVIDLLG